MPEARVGTTVSAHRTLVLWVLVLGIVATAPAQEQPEWSPDGSGDEVQARPPPPGDGAPPTDGDWDDRPGADAPDPDRYEPALQPYGSWGADPQYGRFWRPSVASGWQPYFDGRWAWSSWGWTWLSSEPWSWTYHYGRWSFLPSWGWAWFPGSVWGPAWVQWNWFGGYVGWAPLGYWGRPAHSQYVFVRDADFCAPYLGRRVVRYDRLPSGSLVHWRDHAGQPPPRSTIERVGRHPLTVLGDRPSASLSPWDRSAGRLGRDTGPLILERGNRTGMLAPRQPLRRSGLRDPGLDHTLRPDMSQPRGGVERPWRTPPAGRAPRDRGPRVVERGGGREAAAPRWSPDATRPGSPTWQGGRRGTPTGEGGRWRTTSGSGQMRGTPTHPRGGDGRTGVGRLGGAGSPGGGGGFGGAGSRGGGGSDSGGHGGR